MNDKLGIGTTYAAELQGLALGWTLHGTATVWDITTAPEHTEVLLELNTHPDPQRRNHHPHYARGTVRRLPDGSRQVQNLLTPQPGPFTIGLGWTPRRQHDPAHADHHRTQAESELTPWAPLADDDSPLGESALTWLARAVVQATEGAAAAKTRDHLIRRLRAGDVPRDAIARIVGCDPSRITQIANGKTAKAA